MTIQSIAKTSSLIWGIVLLAAFSVGCEAKPDPAILAQNLAEEYIDDNVDSISEDIAGLIYEQNPLLREIGGELIEDEIHQKVQWIYSPATSIGDETYKLVATGQVDVEVGVSIAKVTVEVDIPIDLTIDVASERVVSDIDLKRARIDFSR